jgi:hypothetical protein
LLKEVVLQALCPGCHRVKTAAQGNHQGTPESHLSDEVWTALVDGKPPLALVFETEEPPSGKLCWVDRRRSRQRILTSSRYKWPVCLPHDRIEPYDRTLGDFCYVLHRPACELTPRVLLKEAPLRGNGWYHRSVVELCLETQLLTHDRILFKITASCWIPADKFSEAFQRVLSKLPEDDVKLNERWTNLHRDCSHRLVGLFGKRNATFLKATTSQCPQDEEAFAPIGVTYKRNADGDWWDFFKEIPTSTRHTHYLLYRKVIDEESSLLTRLLYRVNPSRVFQLNTDSILYQGSIPDDLGENVRGQRVSDHRLRGKCKLPLRDDPLPSVAAPWTDVDRSTAWRHVMTGGSLCVEALAGCGKSTLLREFAAQLREAGKRVQMVALTHVATANLEDETAMTIARFTYHYGKGVKNRPDVLVLDEISLVDAYLYTHLATILHHAQCQCIFAGDWSQLPPVQNVYQGFVAPTMRNAPWLKERCGYTRLTLTECVRSDARLHTFYSAVAENEHVPLGEIVQLAIRKFPLIDGFAPINLVCSHKRRVALIRDLQELVRPPDAIWVEPSRSNAVKNVPQPLWLWRGMHLICATRLNNLRNQWTYEVVELTDAEAHLRALGSDKVHKFPHQKVVDYFRSTLARTYHSAQGLTFDCRVRLWDTRGMHFSRQHLIVGMSRCTRSELLDFGISKDAFSGRAS